MLLECEKCGHKDYEPSGFRFYDVNGHGEFSDYCIEQFLLDPSASAHILCNKCAKEEN